MVTTDVEHELQLQLREAGRQLSKPPESLDKLLHLLDQTDKLLSMVDQSPNSLMQEALDQPTKALFNESLLKHSSMDVRASVASCLCEITRITAPDAPYGDEEMKDVFQLVVSSLEDLSDESSRSYRKRVSIIETIAKVKSCVIMLDLECDDLIVEMFEHFMKSVRDHHLKNIYSPMVNIMALVLEESEEISVDMIKPLLARINNSEGVLPVARKLGEEVLKKSADKLRPQLERLVTSLGGSLDNYSKVLTSICEGTSDIVEHNDESASVQPKVDETKLTPLSDSTAQVMSNGKTVSGDEGGSHNKQSEKPDEAVNHPDSNLTSKADTNDLVVESSGKSESKQDAAVRKSPEPSGSSQLGENKTEKTIDIPVSAKPAIESEIANAVSLSQSKSGITKGKRSKKQKPAKTVQHNIPNLAGAGYGKPVQTVRPQIVVGLSKIPDLTSDSDMKSPKRARKSTAKVEENKPSSQSLKKDSVAKKSKPSGKKANAGKSESAKSKQAAKKVDAGDSKVKTSKQSSKKDNEIDSDGKPLKQPGEKGEKSKVIAKPSEDAANKDEGSDSEVTPVKVLTDDEDERTDSDDIPLKRAAKKGNKSVSSVAISAPKKKDAKKTAGDNNVQENDQAQSVSEDDGMNVSLKSALKTATKGEGKLEKAVPSSSKRKRPVGKAKVTETVKYDETLVDQKVKVWWPEDKVFYEGVVSSFNADTKEHQVLYLDGEQETLNLKTETWEPIQKYSVDNEEKAAEVEIESTDVVPETPKKKKAKIDSGVSAPQGKSKDLVKRAGGASASGKSKGAASKSAGKSKGEASKSAGKSKGEAKANTKSKPVNLKKGEKSKEDDVEMSETKGEAKANTKSKPANLKEGKKSKEDDVEISETITEKKQEPSQKIVYKRGKRKTASKIAENEEKSEAKDTSDTKSISENVKESDDGERDDVKEKPPVTPKTESKSGKKRKKT
ncbi:Armadillo-like helical [Artemisia annua]|uniref:Armadillo-like helical n=1 Tax=Artemisia annua TaxID=35608 RepID=A0A2U1PK16_ARTAN|nr:Armadillo-like helical [Artemisia annua]